MTVAELESQIAALSRAEKAELLQKLAQELHSAGPGIEKIAGVVGGAACITGTRIPVWILENYRRLGWTEAQILENYPTLRAADLVNAWAYVEVNPAEIEHAIHTNETA
jgi:uncharacterized protein (DUF433 family)